MLITSSILFVPMNYISIWYYLGGQTKFSLKGNLRYAKFVGASPEIIHTDKVADLVANPNILFARKFDMEEDRGAVEKLVREIKNKTFWLNF